MALDLASRLIARVHGCRPRCECLTVCEVCRFIRSKCQQLIEPLGSCQVEEPSPCHSGFAFENKVKLCSRQALAQPSTASHIHAIADTIDLRGIAWYGTEQVARIVRLLRGRRPFDGAGGHLEEVKAGDRGQAHM